MVSILDDARQFFSAQTDFATLQDNFDFLNPTHPPGGAIKPGFLFPLEIFHAKAPVGLNNAQNLVEMLFSGEAYYYKSAVCLQNTFLSVAP